jgi:predicted metal-dependent hydrolase
MPYVPAKVVRSLRKTLTLHVLPDKSLLIKAPFFTSQRDIDNFVRKNEDWIEKRLQMLQSTHRTEARKFKTGEVFLYLGESLMLYIGNYTSIAVKGEKLLFPQFLVFRIEKELGEWYISQAKKIITEQTEYFARQMKTSYKSIMFSDTKSKWGSCTSDNRLQFSWRLVMAPLLVINYVVIHELAHTIEKNHSLRFWNLVRSQSPSYKQQRKWLKENGHSMIT